MKCFFLFLSLLISLIVQAQPLLKNDAPAPSGGNTYAIVIGISSYADPDIPKLSFSHTDAIVFADFLQSASGGSVPRENIKLLTDSMATTFQVDKSIRWLVANCKEGDKVFFYFSGHGEMENVSRSKNGYLICYNTPSVAFVHMGLSIDYLNDIVNTLSVDTKAKVIVITDACHSGTMAGNKFKGNFFVGEQLMLKKQNEIRMASSKPDQLSNEKEDWGGGRGVFSYHLVNGLQGDMADANHDKVVSVAELKTYLENKMAEDPILKFNGDVQTPVITFNSDFKLATVVDAEAIKIKEQVQSNLAANSMVMADMAEQMADAAENMEPADYFFSLISTRLEGLTDSLKLDTFSTDRIASRLIEYLLYEPQTENGGRKLGELHTALTSDKEKLSRFNLDLAEIFMSPGQAVIANYIKGDEAELERRRYYNIKNNGYDVYVKMFAIALKLSRGDKYNSSKAEVFLHYFSGLALRIKIPLTKNPAPLIEQALVEQKKALALEEHAAYIYNELGNLYKYKNNYALAEKYYTTATHFSPQWALPQANLCAIYSAIGKYDKSAVACGIADSLQSGLQLVAVNKGILYERTDNHLFAEEYYHKAIASNSRHFFPFERLGYVNMNTTNYAMADSFFYEAEQRKKGYHFKDVPDMVGDGVIDNLDVEPNTPSDACNIDTSKITTTDIFGQFALGVQEYRRSEYSNAIKIFKRVIAVDKANPLVFHYLGKVYYNQQKWEEAAVYFKFALTFSKNIMEFANYVDSVKRSFTYTYDHTCLDNFFSNNYYNKTEDYYFLGTICQRWNHVEEAELYFKRVIELDERNIHGYYKLWNLYETRSLYLEAEAVIKNYAIIDTEQAERELNAFYTRTLEKFPDDGTWNYKLGLLLYKRAVLSAADGSFNQEGEDAVSLPGSLTMYYIPGTGEAFKLADTIYFPEDAATVFLNKAAALLSEREPLADINFKIGNLYLWKGLQEQAYPYFEKSLSLVPRNGNARLKLIDIYKAMYKNKAALEQLNYLYDSSQVDFEKRLLLAQFDIRAGQFDKASQLLNNAEVIYPYVLPQIDNLRGLLNMLAEKPTDAIAAYKKSIRAQRADPWFNNYSLARLYAKTGNTKEAWKYLQGALDGGFNYSYVLQNDSYMKSLRKTAKWQTVIDGIPMKKYESNKPVN